MQKQKIYNSKMPIISSMPKIYTSKMPIISSMPKIYTSKMPIIKENEIDVQLKDSYKLNYS